MLALILGFLGKLLPGLFGQLLAKPNPVVTEAREAATAETNLATERTANAEVQKAVEARRAADVRDADPAGLRSDDGFRRD